MTNKKTISHFQILEPLGAGGMGQVYKALDTKLKRIVALKFVSGDLMEKAEARHRLLREARSAATLNHPNICTIHEVGEVQPGEDLKLESGEQLPPGTPFIAMELIEGKPLDRVLSKSGPLPIDEFLDIAVQMAEGLAEAHAQGIVHRDLKPQNVVVTPKGLVKILERHRSANARFPVSTWPRAIVSSSPRSQSSDCFQLAMSIKSAKLQIHLPVA